MTTRTSKAAVALLTVLTWSVTSHPLAYAQGASKGAAAEALFDEVKSLMTQGRFSTACLKFAESQRLDPGTGTLLNLADCYEKNGQTASAWVTFKDSAASARSAGQSEREMMALKRASALEAKLSRLTLQVSAAAEVPGFEIRRDGVVIGKAEWWSAIPVDPGQHTIEASAPGRKTWSTVVKVEASAVRVEVAVPPLEENRDAQLASANASTRTTTSSVRLPSDTAESSDAGKSGGSTQRMVAIGVGTAGAAGLVIGSVLGLSAKSKWDDSRELCPTSSCSDSNATELAKSASNTATASTISFVVGGAALVGGVVLYVTAPSSQAGKAKSGVAQLNLTPLVLPSVEGMSLSGSFF